MAVLGLLVCVEAFGGVDDQLIQAAKSGDVTLVYNLLKKGADANAKDRDGWTALKWAVWHGQLEMVKVLVEGGANINAKILGGRTLLMESAARDHELREAWYRELWYSLRRLYRYGFMGPTRPSGKEDPQIVRLLLKKGADVNAKDKDGWTALKRAQKRGATEIMELLKAHGAKE
jgi:ankyrin repeat protein